MLSQQELDVLWQAQQAHHVGDGRAILAGPLGDLFVGELELLRQSVECVRDLYRVQILSLDILDEGDFHQPFISEVLYDDRYPLEIRHPSGAPPALASYQLVTDCDLPDNQRLDDSVFPDRLSQFRQTLRLKDSSWLEWIRLNVADRHE
jgi:hypothetical protein